MSPFASLVALGFVLAIGLLVFAIGLSRAASGHPAPENAAPAPDPTPAQGQARALCNRLGHAIPNWAHRDGMWFCVRGCGYTAVRHPRDEVPFDRVKAEEIAQLEQLWRVS